MTVSFERPPINEVVIGKVFAPIEGFLVPHYGKFWSLVEDEFPTCKHATVIADSPTDVAIDAATGTPLPRVMFISQDGSRLIQLQGNRLFFNWRQTSAEVAYPRFEKLFLEYQKIATLLNTMCAAEFGATPQTSRYELAYVNIFPVPSGDMLDGLRKTITALPTLADSTSLGKVKNFSSRTDFLMPDDMGTIRVIVAQAAHSETQATVNRLDFQAVGKKIDADFKATEEQWFSKAHLSIVNGFCEVTSKEAQQQWNRIS